MTFAVGQVLQIRATHPHGPGKVRVVAIERVMGEMRPRCEHVHPHSCLGGGCDSEFFVMRDSDMDSRFAKSKGPRR